MLKAELIEFAHCIRDHRRFSVDINDVLHGKAVFDAIARSASGGGIVEISRYYRPCRNEFANAVAQHAPYSRNNDVNEKWRRPA